MNLIAVMEMFPIQTDCMDYLERLRWQGSPECPHCESSHTHQTAKRTACGAYRTL